MATLINNATNYKSCTFSAHPSVQMANATGDATVAQITLDTAVINEGSHFSTVGSSYTVPFTGNYLIAMDIKLSGILNTHTVGQCTVYVDGAAALALMFFQPYNVAAGGTTLTVSGNSIFSLTAAEVLTFIVKIEGGNKVVNIEPESYVMGTFIL